MTLMGGYEPHPHRASALWGRHPSVLRAPGANTLHNSARHTRKRHDQWRSPAPAVRYADLPVTCQKGEDFIYADAAKGGGPSVKNDEFCFELREGGDCDEMVAQKK